MNVFFHTGPTLFSHHAFCCVLQVYAEFNRVVTKNLQVDFFEALDRHAPRFVEIFKAKKGSMGQTLTELVQQIDAGVSLFFCNLNC